MRLLWIAAVRLNNQVQVGHGLAVLRQARGDFRILAHRVFRRAEDINRIILPISFDGTKEALAQNIQTRRDALAYLEGGGAIGVFPGGTVSTAAKPLLPRQRTGSDSNAA